MNLPDGGARLTIGVEGGVEVLNVVGPQLGDLQRPDARVDVLYSHAVPVRRGGSEAGLLRRQLFLDDHRAHHGLGRLRGVPVLGSFGDKGGESSAPLLFRTVKRLGGVSPLAVAVLTDEHMQSPS
jgi:hypothetical protein